ncbi:hypothetical protein M9Y10_034943 [Tritrichomonas musculus]|uniref:Uncharacterized protein n=1 Tax=Tritrichomonas musculus TaxID=1915356 RepID=A0ABR2KGC9_9EUKA
MTSSPKKRRQQSLSAFAQSAFERDIMPTSEEDVDKILKQIHKIDNGKVKHRNKIPSYVDRLLNNEEGRTRSRVKSANSPQIRKQTREIREVKKVVNPLDGGPSAVHYSPNFDSVLTSQPKHQFQKAERNPTASANLEVCTMGEMLQQWSGQLRRINFENPTKATPTKKKRINNWNNSVSSTSDLNDKLPERTTVRPPPDTPPPPKPQSKIPGLISGEANRDSFMYHEYNPGPSQYQTNLTSTLKRPRTGLDFGSQASRPTTTIASTATIHNVGANIDATKPRTAQCIPFDKQSSRFPSKRKDDSIWEEIEAEQERIINSLKTEETKKEEKKKTKEPFMLQTSNPKHPFQHIMRKETEPSQLLDVEGNLKTLDRPVTSLDISTPAESSDRTIYRKSDSPDVFYNDINEQFKATIPRATSPVPIARTVTRHPPYYYMPKPCGQGLYNVPSTSMSTKRTIHFDKMGERQYMLDSSFNTRKNTGKCIPPPLENSIF